MGKTVTKKTFWIYLILSYTLDLFASDPFKIMLSKGGILWKLWNCDKTSILNDLDYKADIGQHFHKSEESARWRHCHKIIKKNLKTLVSPLLTRSQRSQGWQTMRQDSLNMPVEVWCAKIAPKLKNIWKSLRKQGFFDIFSSILMVFEVCVFWGQS